MKSICLTSILLLASVSTNLSAAQDANSKQPTHDAGEVYVNVSPEEAYIWVDGKPVTHRNSILKLAPGEHMIAVYNYGYLPEVHNVAVQEGKYMEVTAHLKHVDEKVSGPWGRIQIEGTPGTALVFLNGTGPEFFVGHADEMNNHIIGDQQLIVPVGTHQVHILANKTGQEIWAGPVEVKENERVIIYAKNQPGKELVYKHWPEGKKLNALSRFEAGTASARIAVAPVKGNMVVDRREIKCGEPVKVSWESTDAATTIVQVNGQPLASARAGSIEAQPKQNAKFEFRAAGPGGIVTSDAAVNVDTQVKTSLTAVAPEIRYVKQGDTVQEQGSTELRWTASNADSVTLDPVGTVTGSSGSQRIQAVPRQSGPGPIDETSTYKITATNVCGGSDTSMASVHVTGSIGPEQVVAQAAPPVELPATASPLPQLALLAIIFLATGILLGKTRPTVKDSHRFFRSRNVVGIR
jgi:hypothetical protein